MTTHLMLDARMTPTCQARPDRYEPSTMRCIACRLAWDKDEPRECPLNVPLVPEAPLQFVSGLPDR